MVKRVLVASAATMGCLVAVAAPANAWPSGVYVNTTPTQTGAKFTSGTGHIRAGQICETSNGQTDWYSYGPWVGINTASWTGSCTYIRERFHDLSN